MVQLHSPDIATHGRWHFGRRTSVWELGVYQPRHIPTFFNKDFGQLCIEVRSRRQFVSCTHIPNPCQIVLFFAPTTHRLDPCMVQRIVCGKLNCMHDACTRSPILTQPRITCRWVLLGLIASARGCGFLCEQPRSSLMASFAYFRHFALAVRPMFWDQVSLSGSYNKCVQYNMCLVTYIDRSTSTEPCMQTLCFLCCFPTLPLSSSFGF